MDYLLGSREPSCKLLTSYLKKIPISHPSYDKTKELPKIVRQSQKSLGFSNFHVPISPISSNNFYQKCSFCFKLKHLKNVLHSRSYFHFVGGSDGNLLLDVGLHRPHLPTLHRDECYLQVQESWRFKRKLTSTLLEAADTLKFQIKLIT